MITHFLALVVLASAPDRVHRCGLELLPPGWKPSAPPVLGSGAGAGRSQAAGLQTLLTDHFAIYWTVTDSDKIVAGTGGTDPNLALAGDNVPALVRAAATGLEKAWHYYVDSLGYPRPKPVVESFHWAIAVPAGKYPVEMCDAGLAWQKKQNLNVFGLTIPYTDGSSSMLLGSNIANFGSWSYAEDANRAKSITSIYARNWDTVMRATAAHELFHAIQFNYETGLSHFLFESSAVSMETRVIPEEHDYLYYSRSDATGLCALRQLLPLTGVVDQSNQFSTYEHAWYVKQIAQDAGIQVVRDLWEARANSDASILTTLRAVLDKTAGYSYDTSLARYALRIGLSGRRTNWLAPGFTSFSDAGLFPTLTGTLPAAASARSVPLVGGALQVWVDTNGNASDRIVNWLPDAGAALRHAWISGATSGSEWVRGPVRQSASLSRQDVWALANPGPQSAVRSFAKTDSANPYLWSSPAPTRSTASQDQSFTWTSGEATLAGNPAMSALCTPLLYTDVWIPHPKEDPTAGSVTGRTGGHALVLADADRTLRFSKATLTVPYGSIGTATVDDGDGIWRAVPFTTTGTTTTLDLGALDLALPLRILVAPGSGPAAQARPPYPNPSRHGASIHFPLTGIVAGSLLEILSADGMSIRRIEVPDGKSEAVWDVRNGSGHRVRPGVYWYIWHGVEGARRGELLVAD